MFIGNNLLKIELWDAPENYGTTPEVIQSTQEVIRTVHVIIRTLREVGDDNEYYHALGVELLFWCGFSLVYIIYIIGHNKNNFLNNCFNNYYINVCPNMVKLILFLP